MDVYCRMYGWKFSFMVTRQHKKIRFNIVLDVLFQNPITYIINLGDKLITVFLKNSICGRISLVIWLEI